eukprot:tig00020538_g10374.t1
MAEAAAAAFVRIGLDEKTAKQVSANEKVTAALLAVIDEAGVSGGCDKAAGVLLYALSTKCPAPAIRHRRTLAQYIATGKIRISPQFDAAIEFLKATGNADLDIASFEASTGVGVVITPDQIASAVKAVIEANKEKLLEDRYRFPVGLLLKGANERLKWAEGGAVKNEIDAQVAALLGPKTEDDLAEKPKVKKKPAEKKEAAPTAEKEAAPAPKKEKWDFAARELDAAKNTPELLEKHRKATGGRVVSRFPPEPNGHLHLGHAKAMWVDFGYAAEAGGDCIMRFDDTNPEAEKKEYIESILEDVHWMGWKPAKVTYSSDYFGELYDLAVELIKRGKAYVDHQTPEEMSSYRDKKMNSPWRDRSVEENLKLFEDMRKGKFGEGQVTLRMKGDMTHPNPCMRDLVAYRVKLCPHPHSGDKWCIYPSYDYTHCLVDSLENITHSLCTLEFEIRRDTYYWLLEALDLYRPHVWEYNRLNLSHNVVSKRKLLQLVNEKHVTGWDDPRLLTIKGLRRRGYTASALNKFCDMVGVSRSDQFISYRTLEGVVRDECDEQCSRAMAVLAPLKVTITNWPQGKVEQIQIANHPKYPERGTHTVAMTGTVYIEQTDFRLEDSKDYFGLAPNKEVMLRYAINITCKDVKKSATGEVVELLCEADFSKARKPKGVLHWVSESAPGQAPAKAEVRLYDTLFSVEDPASHPNWLTALNPNSLVVTRAYLDPFLAGAREAERFQFERQGYFVVDPDSKPGNLVFNRICTLRDSYHK